MKKGVIPIILLIAIALFYFLYQNFSIKKTYDIVITGGGLSGLSAAYSLRANNVLVLEKENYTGGRVKTGEYKNIRYDLGAFFDYEGIPFAQEGIKYYNSNYILETGPIGIYYENKICTGMNVEACLKKLPFDQQSIESMLKYSEDSSVLLSDKCHSVISTFFNAVHPGEMREYIHQRQSDAFIKFNISHYALGHRELVEWFVKNSNADIYLNSFVESITDNGDMVSIIYNKNGFKRKVDSKAAVVTVNPASALKIIKNINPDTKKFLQQIKYASVTVVALIIKNIKIPDFSYIVMNNSASSAIFKQKTKEPDVNVFLIYFCDKASMNIEKLNRDKMIEVSKKELWKLASFKNEDILFTDYHYWPAACAIISDTAYSCWQNSYRRASRNVFLAGDYLYYNKKNILPLGMQAAIISGRETAFDMLMIKRTFK